MKRFKIIMPGPPGPDFNPETDLQVYKLYDNELEQVVCMAVSLFTIQRKLKALHKGSCVVYLDSAGNPHIITVEE